MNQEEKNIQDTVELENGEVLQETLTKLEREQERIMRSEEEEKQVKAKEQEGYNSFTGEIVKLIPYPNFSGAKSIGTMLPMNMANETVTNLSTLSKEFDFIDFIVDKLGYSSRLQVVQCFAAEQIDALVFSIRNFENKNGFILGDMAGIGKGRVCAGVLRYAYRNGFVPIFLTQKPYLLNDIYRDLVNIGGFGFDSKGKIIPIKPLVLHQDGVILDKTLQPIKTEQVYKTIEKDGVKTYKFLDNIHPYSINELCKDINEKITRTGRIALPKEFNCVMLPYSVISQGKGTIRRSFISALAPNSIFVFDESHNAASANVKSNILKYSLPYVEQCEGVLFSSATYAKNPNVFNLYVVKTSLHTAVPSLDAIADALKVGGENVSEYIASGLVKETQMLRRERSFGDCKKVTEYVGTRRIEDLQGESVYEDLEGDLQGEIYNEAIEYFKQMRDFSKSEKFRNAINRAVLRRCEELGYELADTVSYTRAKSATNDEQAGRLRADFVRENRNKYLLTYSYDSISRYKATFRENLFLAVKAKFSADKIIEILNTPVEYKNTDGSVHVAPQKPIIAMANTGEAIFNELRFDIGQEVSNDFSEYLRAIYNKLFYGNFKLRKVDRNIFDTISNLQNDGIDYELIEDEFRVDYSDFDDEGAEVQRIQEKLNAYKTELPFSIIDYLRERIENEVRSPIYFDSYNRPRFGRASSTKYRFAEGTSRSYMLKRDDSGVLRFQKNDRIKSTTNIFRAFNNGDIDVMLINVVASTGGSAQSSPEEGIDNRPRNMVVVQFELDINIEVQKRGRINRTGQINSPTYTYIITKIPVELRKYLMFRRKLRKLDANTSADQTASVQSAEIKSPDGKIVEDIFNHYGYEVFKNDFIDLPDYVDYKNVFEDMLFISKKVDAENEAEEREANVEEFNAFIRELELYPVDFQKRFFDAMNEKYLQKKENLLAKGEYQEELTTLNYKASLKQRVVIQLNSGSTVFSLPLFLADYYTLQSKRPLSRQQMQRKMNDLAVWQGQKVTPDEFYSLFVADFLRESNNYLRLIEEDFEAKRPMRSSFEDDAEGQQKYEDSILAFELKKTNKLSTERELLREAKELISVFKPDTNVVYGKFIGYKIKETGTKFKYTRGNIEFIFCFLKGAPVIHLKMSSGMAELRRLKDDITFLSQDVPLVRKIRQEVIDWNPNLYERIVRRFLTGNILSAIVEANQKKRNGEIKNWSLIRYTNIDNSVSTAIELDYGHEFKETSKINVQAQTLSVNADNPNLLEYLEGLPISIGTDFKVNDFGNVYAQNIYPVWNVPSDKICDRGICIVKKVQRLRDEYNRFIDREYYEFQIIQSFAVRVDKVTKQKSEVERTTKDSLYNVLYHDKQFEETFQSRMSTVDRTPEKTVITYAIRVEKVKGKKKDEDDNVSNSGSIGKKYERLRVAIKKFFFKVDDVDGLNSFLSELYKKYEVSFSLKSNIAEYYNIEPRADAPADEGKKQNYFASEFEYRFMRKVPETTIQTIPNIVRKTDDGANGGVIVSYPITPSLLPSYELKPYRFNPQDYVKIAFSVLGEDDKIIFLRSLNEMKDADMDDFTFGEFISKFLSQRSVGTTYFFGDLRLSDFGKIFRQFIMNEKIEELIFEEKEEEVIDVKPPVSVVNYDDAQEFLIHMYKLI